MHTLVDALLDALRLESELVPESEKTINSASKDLKKRLELWGAGICRIVVVGEVKRGKSSFINALLGHRNLVPVGDNITTSTVFKVHYDKKPGYKVHFTKESAKETLHIDIDDKKSIENYGTEIGNPGNFAEVDYIEVGVDSEVLKSGIVLIDTPGLGGIYKHHKEITYTYIPRADAVFFVLASDQPPIGQMEVEYLKTISKITPFIYFIQTRFTEASSVEARDELKDRNLDLISRVLDIPKNRIPYFVLDSELKLDAEENRDLEDLRVSRFPQLMAYIKSVLQSNQQKMLATRAIWSMAPTLNHLSELLTTRRAFLNANTKEKLKELKKDIAVKQHELEEWKKSKKSDVLIRKVDDAFRNVLKEAEKMLQNKCGKDSLLKLELEAELRDTKDSDSLDVRKQIVQTKFREDIAKIAYEVDHYVEQSIVSLLQTLVKETMDEALQKNVSEQDFDIDKENLRFRQLKEHKIKFLGFSIDKDTLYATGSGVSAAGLFGTLAGIVGWIVVATSAVALGFVAAFAVSRYVQLEFRTLEAKEIFAEDIENGLQKAQNGILEYLENKYNNFIVKAKEQIDAYIKQREAALKKDYEDVQQRMRGKADELLNEQTTQQQRERRFACIQSVVNRWNDILF